jgi:hypothetical protein
MTIQTSEEQADAVQRQLERLARLAQIAHLATEAVVDAYRGLPDEFRDGLLASHVFQTRDAASATADVALADARIGNCGFDPYPDLS